MSKWKCFGNRRAPTANLPPPSMRSAPPDKRCIHCLQPIRAKSEDHVFPTSWYPDTTPDTVQRWKVPSCPDCNNRLGKVEKELLIRVGICMGPDVVEASGIPGKVLRTLGVGGAGGSEKERGLRGKTKQRIVGEFIPY